MKLDFNGTTYFQEVSPRVTTLLAAAKIIVPLEHKVTSLQVENAKLRDKVERLQRYLRLTDPEGDW